MQDSPIRRTQQYSPGLEGLFSFHTPSQPFSFSPFPTHRTTVHKRMSGMKGTWQTAQNFIQVPPPVDVELHTK